MNKREGVLTATPFDLDSPQLMPITLQCVMKTLQQLKGKGKQLPVGCSALELIDDDDALQWYVTLSYRNDEATVSVKLLFEVGTTRMPKVFVIQPRLKADFIHHGAVCARDLFTQSWELTLESITLLILSLHVTLDPSRPGTTVDASQPHYNDAEHQSGALHIISEHPAENRPAVAVVPSLPEGDDAQRPVEVELPLPVVNREMVIVESQRIDRIDVPRGTTLTMLPGGDSESFMAVAVSRAVTIAEGAVLIVKGLELIVDEAIVCRGRLCVSHGTVDGGITVDGRGVLDAEAATVRGHLTALDCAAVTLLGTCVIQQDVEATKEEVEHNKRAAVFIGNSARLTTERHTVVIPMPHVEAGIAGEQHATIVLTDTVVFCGSRCCVELLGCSGVLRGCVFSDPGGKGLYNEMKVPKRTLGLQATSSCQVTVTRCVVFQTFFGFAVSVSSVGTFDQCVACDVVTGFDVDASTVTMQHCHALAESVGVMLRSGAKCTVGAQNCTDDIMESASHNIQRQVDAVMRQRRALKRLTRGAINPLGVFQALQRFTCTTASLPSFFLFGRDSLKVIGGTLEVSYALGIGAVHTGLTAQTASVVSLHHVEFTFRPKVDAIHDKVTDLVETKGVHVTDGSTLSASFVVCNSYYWGFYIHSSPCALPPKDIGANGDWSTGNILDRCATMHSHIGIMIDAAVAQLHCCSVSASQAAVFVLRGSQVKIIGDGGGVRSRCNGVEVSESTVLCEDMTVYGKSSAFMVRGSGGLLDLRRCTVIRTETLGTLLHTNDPAVMRTLSVKEVSKSFKVCSIM
jgi:hypothetical protein